MSKISFLHVNLGGLRYRKNDSLKIKIHYLFLSFDICLNRSDFSKKITSLLALISMKTLRLHFPPRNSISKKRRNLLSTKGGKKKEGGRIEACRPERVSWRKNRISRSPSNFIRRSIDRSTCTRLSFHFLPSNYAIIALISDNRQLSCIQRLVSAVDKQDCSLFPPQPV